MIFALFVIVMAAGEAAVALAIVLNFYNNHTTVDVDTAEELKGDFDAVGMRHGESCGVEQGRA